MKILAVVDAYGWAYDVGMSGLYKELHKKHPKWVLDKCIYKDVRERKINTHQYDVVFVWGWMHFYGNIIRPWMDVLDKLDPKNTVLCMSGEHYLHVLKEGFNKIKRFNFKYFAGNNENITEHIHRALPHKSTHILEFGVDLGMFKPTPPPRKFIVGWVGHQGRTLKRYDLAKEICTNADAKMRVAGHVTKTNYIPHDKMPDFYNGISCLFITSETEAHPLIFYEALASGRPVVATLVGDIPNTARQGKNGYYFPVDSPIKDIVNYIKSLKKHPALIRQMGKHGRKDVEDRWGWSKISKNYIKVINEVCGICSSLHVC